MSQKQNDDNTEVNTPLIVYLFFMLVIILITIQIEKTEALPFIIGVTVLISFVLVQIHKDKRPTIWDSREKREAYARKIGAYKKIPPMTPKDEEKNDEEEHGKDERFYSE